MTESFVLNSLLDRNVQWARDMAENDPNFFPESAAEQAPKVLWIGCADSRVPESVITASRPSDIFVHRNIANQFHLTDDNATSVLTFAVNSLKVKHVIIVGHTQCGGVRTCANAAGPSGPPLPDNALGRWLAPLTELARTVEGDLIEANVRVQVQNIVKSEVIKAAWDGDQDVYVHGWVYALENGKLQDLGVSVGRNSAR